MELPCCIIISIIIHSEVINTTYWVVLAKRIRTHIIVLLAHRVGDEPAAEGRAVLAGAEVQVRDGEVRGLVLLAGEAVTEGYALGDCAG